MQASASSRNRLSLAILALALLPAACASTQDGPAELPIDGTWAFNGKVEGAHQMRTGAERFMEPVSGTVDFLPDVIVVNGTHGSCTIPRNRAGGRMNQLSVRCGTMSLTLGPTRGEVTIPVQRLVERRTSCAQYANDDRGAGCIEWNYTLGTQTVRLTGALNVLESGAP